MNSIDCKILLALILLLLLFTYGFSLNKENIRSVTGNESHIDLISKKQITAAYKDLSLNQSNIKIRDVDFRDVSPKKQKIIIAWFTNN
nr:hypothetical protein [uncultured Desulfobacter sp.]